MNVLSGSVNSARSSISGLDQTAVDNASKIGLFFAWEWRRTIRQLTRCKQRKDKSISKSSSQFFRSLKSFFKHFGDGKCISLLGFLLLIRILLLRGGIESNPGPAIASSAVGASPLGGFRVLSQNCRGLSERKKLIRILQKIYPSRRSTNATIACLQETHCVDRFAIDNYFRGKAIVNDGERNQRGVCILVPDSFEVCSSIACGAGRWIIVTVRQNCSQSNSNSDRKYLIANIYAPNCHREGVGFYQDFLTAWDNCTEELVTQDASFDSIITGDFNLVLDRIGGSSNRAGSRAERDLVALLADGLEWRDLVEPNDLKLPGTFTWRRGTCLSKLDYIFLSRALNDRVASAVTSWHELGANLDHAAISVSLESERPSARGRSFPKIFKSDIRLEADRVWLANQLEEGIAQMPMHWDPHLKLDFAKMTLRSKTLELRLMRKRENNLLTIREGIKSMIAGAPLNVQESTMLDSMKLKLRELEEEESKALSMRAGVKWREEGEKSNAYFLARYKARIEGAIMYSINLGTRVVKGSEAIVKTVREFYVRLYSERQLEKLRDHDFSEEFFALCPSLDREQQLLMSKPLDLAELKETLKSCSDSAPGLDGIPYSFYESFSDPLLNLLIESWNFAIQSGSLARSHRQSCISLLPKKGKDLTILGNWRPISLSACDLKIITKAYANRLKVIMPNILCEAQAAYCPGRDISFNNRMLQYAKLFAEREGLDYSIVSLDAQKAFDSVSHEYLVKVLEVYGFPPEFLQVFRTLYKDLKAVVQVNGFLSQEFDIKRGVKQGDALSCGLFVLGIDPLLRNILANPNIESLLIPIDNGDEVEFKALAYADDVTVVCKNNESIQQIFSEYERLSLVSGLVLNADKTEVFNLIASQNVRSRIRYLDRSFDLDRVEKIRICGIMLARAPPDEYKFNVLDRIERMESIVKGWGRRSLTLNGRMILAKTFLLSQIVYPAQSVAIGKKEIKKIEKLIYSFVNGARNLYGPERIARTNLKALKAKGGINGIDVDSFIKSLTIKQFGKAAKLHRSLRALQLTCENLRDDISQSARTMLRLNYRNFGDQFAMPDLRQIELLSGIPVVLCLTPSGIAAKMATRLGIESLGSLQRLYHSGRVRQCCSRILRALPNPLANLIRANLLVPTTVNICWFSSSYVARMDVVPSKLIRLTILNRKFPNLGVNIASIHKRADWPPPHPGVELESMYNNLWEIKNPSLRAVRLKLIYKDVFSNERRHRFGICNSPACDVCGQVETVEHHLFSCANATRMWGLFQTLTGISIVSLFDVIYCSSNLEYEIIKSTMVKALLQIDRSQIISNRAIVSDCVQYLKIEAEVNVKRSGYIQRLISRIRAAL